MFWDMYIYIYILYIIYYILSIIYYILYIIYYILYIIYYLLSIIYYILYIIYYIQLHASGLSIHWIWGCSILKETHIWIDPNDYPPANYKQNPRCIADYMEAMGFPVTSKSFPVQYITIGSPTDPKNSEDVAILYPPVIKRGWLDIPLGISQPRWITRWHRLTSGWPGAHNKHESIRIINNP
jgi:hypothetical protein